MVVAEEVASATNDGCIGADGVIAALALSGAQPPQPQWKRGSIKRREGVDKARRRAGGGLGLGHRDLFLSDGRKPLRKRRW